MMHAGLALGTGCGLLLLVFVLAGVGLYWTVTAFVCIVGCLGIASVNADALVLIEFPKQASSASAVTGTLRFGFGALAGPLLAWSYDGRRCPWRSWCWLHWPALRCCRSCANCHSANRRASNLR